MLAENTRVKFICGGIVLNSIVRRGDHRRIQWLHVHFLFSTFASIQKFDRRVIPIACLHRPSCQESNNAQKKERVRDVALVLSTDIDATYSVVCD